MIIRRMIPLKNINVNNYEPLYGSRKSQLTSTDV